MSYTRTPAPRAIVEVAAGKRNHQNVSGSRKATGTVTYSGNLSAGNKVTVNGVDFTAVAAGATGNQFNIGASLTLTLDNMVTVLNNSVDPKVSPVTYSNSGGTALALSFDVPGTAGNAFTLAANAGTVSGATLAGGTDADKLDVKENSVFYISSAAGSNQAIVLPDGAYNTQEITLLFVTKGSGANVVISGTFSGGTTATFDAVADFVKLMWNGSAWFPLINSSVTIA